MDRLADEVRQTSPWTVMYTDDTDEICSESGEKVEASLGGGGGVHQRVVNELENAGVPPRFNSVLHQQRYDRRLNFELCGDEWSRSLTAEVPQGLSPPSPGAVVTHVCMAEQQQQTWHPASSALFNFSSTIPLVGFGVTSLLSVRPASYSSAGDAPSLIIALSAWTRTRLFTAVLTTRRGQNDMQANMQIAPVQLKLVRLHFFIIYRC
ncbi:hypothetical protein F2P81_002183 [Scophthalmus maximus]|uniref:Uncharacterized protein n=2 Tax=Scophthalmus maximus TaxID=52904 RepID=A0A6A4TQZ5_SCOMX|nr:hypothetical protein F2P81_002183 [Scophthalmus maximus]